MGKSTDFATSAVWENETKQIFCDLCLKEVEAGNRLTTFFNREGWQNIAQNFKERTGREYTKVQLKNKWDQLKKEWKLWKELKRGCTGLGWDPRKKTIDASDDWWREKLEVLPNAKKFQYGGIDPELEDKLDMMFGGIVTSGSHAWTSGQQGTNILETPEDGEEPQESNDLNEDEPLTIYTSTQSSSTKRSGSGAPSSRLSKKGTAADIRAQISNLLNICTTLSTGETLSNKIPTLAECIRVVEGIPEVSNDIHFLLFLISLLEDPNKREIFNAISPDRRVQFLRYHFEKEATQPSPSRPSSSRVMEANDRAKCIKLVVATLAMIYEYYETYISKTPCMTSRFIGDKWIGELLTGHPERFHNMFQMSQTIFIDLLDELQSCHGLYGSSRTTPREVLAMTLYILSHKESIRATCERFQHSSEMVSRYFSICLDSLVSLSTAVVKPLPSYFDEIPPEIASDARYMPFFKDCIGAIDGTHVDARVPMSEQIAYIGRCGSPTQNILAACDFNMCFTFLMAGWEGSTHDSRIFKFATRNRQYNFPMPPPGKYYLVDAGFPLQRGFLKPFPDTKYHLPDFQRSSQVIRSKHELFNKRHSSLHGVIERTFGVWKKKWVILHDIPSYPIKKQIKIVGATCALHNYIRRHPSKHDIDFDHLDEDQEYVPAEAHEYQVGHSIDPDDVVVETLSQDGEGSDEMKDIREKITDSLANAME